MGLKNGLEFRARTFAAGHSQDGGIKANKGSIERGALRYEARRYYSSTSGNAWKVVDIRPRVLSRPMDQWDSRQRGRWPIEAKVQTKQRRHAPGRDGIIQMEFTKRGSCWIKIGGVGRMYTTILFLRATPLSPFSLRLTSIVCCPLLLYIIYFYYILLT